MKQQFIDIDYVIFFIPDAGFHYHIREDGIGKRKSRFPEQFLRADEIEFKRYGKGDGRFLARPVDRKSTRLNSSHTDSSRMPSSA